MTQTATTQAAAGDALRAVGPRAMFFTSASALPMLRGPMVAYAPEDDGGTPAEGGDAVDDGDQDDLEDVDDREEGNELGDGEADEEDFDEVEYGEGKKYKVPRELNRGFLREADYSQKTMALARDRDAFTAERAKFTETSQALRKEIGTVHALETTVEQFKGLDWDALRSADIDRYRELQDAYRETRDKLDEAKTSLGAKEREIAEAERQADATRIAETEAALADPKSGIPGWGPQVFQDLVTFAGTQGYSPADLRQASVADWKILHLASVGAASQQRQRRVEQHKTTQQTRPAAPMKGNGAVRDLSSVKSTDEWMRRRNAEVRKRA